MFVVDCWRPPTPDRMAKRDNAPPVRAIYGPFDDQDLAHKWMSAHTKDWHRLVIFEVSNPDEEKTPPMARQA